MKTQKEVYPLKSQVERREKVIAEVLNLCKIFYPKDFQMLSGIVDLTTELKLAEFNKTTITFIDGMYGFMLWANGRADVDSRSAFTTLIHDLSEFAKNRNENWFCPRTSRYEKYLSGASGVQLT